MEDTLSLLLSAIVGSRHNPLDELKIDTGGLVAVTHIITITPTNPTQQPSHYITSRDKRVKIQCSFRFLPFYGIATVFARRGPWSWFRGYPFGV